MNLRKRHLTAIILVFFAGVLLHFAYDSDNPSLLSALAAPVSESTFEHLKLLFTPVLLLGILEYFRYGKSYAGFFPATVFSLTAGMAMLIVLFYTYTGMLGFHLLVLDILVYLLSVLSIYILRFLLLSQNRLCGKGVRRLAVVWLFLLFLSVFFFTFFPPTFGLFTDPR